MVNWMPKKFEEMTLTSVLAIDLSRQIPLIKKWYNEIPKVLNIEEIVWAKKSEKVIKPKALKYYAIVQEKIKLWSDNLCND